MAHHISSLWRVALIAALAIACLSGVASADDRDLLRDSTGDPYVFIIFDTSGSMHWTPRCTADNAANDFDPFDNMCTSECPFDDPTCDQVCPDEGCLEYDFDAPLPDPVEVIIDNVDGEPAVVVQGDWGLSTVWPGYYATNYLHDRRNGQGTKRVTFTPNLPQAETYKVFAWWAAASNRDRSVPIDITHAGGTDTVFVNQEQSGGQWVLLGEYAFDAGTGGNVVIRNDGTSDFVIADAVRFLYQPIPPCKPGRTGNRCQQPICTTGDCFAPLNGDDPTSKFFQAKQALFEVLDEVDDVHFGFATYNQDTLRLRDKHWLYEVRDTQLDGTTPQTTIALDSGFRYPPVGDYEVFGATDTDVTDNDNLHVWDCGEGTGLSGRGCIFGNPSDVDDLWERTRVARLPKLGLSGTQSLDLWIRDSGGRYRVTWSAAPNEVGGGDGVDDDGDGDTDDWEIGDPVFAVQISIRECGNAACDDADSHDQGSQVVYYDLRSDFAGWDNGADRGPREAGFFSQAETDIHAADTCNGIDNNTNSDNGQDPFGDDDYNSRFPRVDDPEMRGTLFDVGDVIPLDWLADNRRKIQDRLAPNTINDAAAIPDFRTATYFQDRPVDASDDATDRYHARKVEDDTTPDPDIIAERPLLSDGSTPLGASLNEFRTYYNAFRDIAADSDRDFACRARYVLFLTDGDETCSGDPCPIAQDLNENKGVRTFVVGYGVESNSGNKLTCMAEDGGTGAPLLPQNKDELVAVLTSILSQIRSESRAFASASIPAIQSTAADKIFLSSFTPLAAESFWPGSIAAFRSPLPIKDGKPDNTRLCNDSGGRRDSECFLWDAGEVMLTQAPDADDVDDIPPVFNIGRAVTERRILYGKANLAKDQPIPMRLFDGVPPEDDDREDLGRVLFDSATFDSFDFFSTDPVEQAAIDAGLNAVVGDVVAIKEKTVFPDPTDPTVSEDFTYVLGDVFHAQPRIVSGPNSFIYFQSDLCGLRARAGQFNNCNFASFPGDDLAIRRHGYREFVRHHAFRRQMLVAGANDGQLHFFDAGVSRELQDPQTGETFRVFLDGSGREILSFMPRLTLPVVREQVERDRHIFSLDGDFSVEDVFIDPVRESAGAAIREQDREWRTVLIGGLREGGKIMERDERPEGFASGYFALDITQPDELVEADLIDAQTGNVVPFGGDIFPPDATTPEHNPTCLEFDDTTGDHIGLVNGAAHHLGCQLLTGERIPFPAQLWSFTDSYFDAGGTLPNIAPAGDEAGHFEVNGPRWFRLDEDNVDGAPGYDPSGRDSSYADLGQTWSKPVIGQILVCDGNACDPADPANDDDITARHVAVFAGGMDVVNKDNPRRGNWLYMVDVETGEAIYKRRLRGAAPADPTVLDANGDGFFDLIYVGTTAGILYKVDLNRRTAGGEIPRFEVVTLHESQVLGLESPLPATTDDFFITFDRIEDEAWDPFPIYSTGGPPIMVGASAFFLPERQQYALAFGTGDREDLWSLPAVLPRPEGQFVVLVDDDFVVEDVETVPLNCDELPLRESCLEEIPFGSSPRGPDENLLLEPLGLMRAGWVMTFPGVMDVRLANPAFIAAGILVFSVFEPDPPNDDPGGAIDIDGDGIPDLPCARTGQSVSFVVLARNANPVITATVDDTSCADIRCETIEGLTTRPFIEGATKNPPDVGGGGGGGGDDDDDDDGGSGDDDDDDEPNPWLDAARRAILEHFPRGARFNDTMSIELKVNKDSTGVAEIIEVPVAASPSDWKDR